MTDERGSEAADEGGTVVAEGQPVWRALLESSPDVVSILARDGTIRYESPAVARLTGQRPEDVVGRSVLEFIHPDDRQGVAEELEAALRAAAEVHVKEYRWRCADGSWRWFETVGRNLMDDPEIRGFVCVTRDVDERRRMKERIQESERFHRVLLSRISDAVFLTRESGDWVFVCPNVEEIFGRGEAEVRETGNVEALLGEGFARRLRGEFDERQNIEWTVRDAAGEEHALLINVKRIDDLRGGTRLVTARDVTERQAAERARRESEHRFRELFDGILDGAYMSTETGRILEVNESLTRMLGYAGPDAMRAVSAVDLYVDPSRRRVLLERLREDGEVHDFPLRLHHATEDRTVECELTAFGRAVGDGMRMMGIVRDVTERRAQEARLRKLSEVVSQAHDAVLISDPEGRIEYANRSFERITGHDVESIVGESVEILQTDLHEPGFFEEMWQTIRDGRVWKGTFLNVGPDGSVRQHEATVSPIRGEEGEIVNFVSQSRDVTRERHLEEALARSRRMETVGRLSSGIAHHFNNLLTSINGYTELLLGGLEEGDPRRDDLSRIKEACTEAAALTRQLVAFSRELQAELEPLDLAGLAGRVVERIRARLPDDVALEIDEGPEGTAVDGDAELLDQVLGNLLWNAREALPEGGRIRVTVEPVELEEPGGCPCGGARAGSFVRLTIGDDGVGMDEKTLARAFEPFFTTKDGGRVGARGAGLGLAACYAIVDGHGGHVCARSRPGEGSRFEVLLPAAAGRPSPPSHEGG